MGYGGASAVPRYRPSLQKKGRGAGSPLQSDAELHPSPPGALDDLLQELKVSHKTLEVSLSPMNWVVDASAFLVLLHQA